MSKETKEVAKKEQNTALSQSTQATWGNENVDKSDIMLGKILLMQGLSEAVMDGKAKFGDMLDSLEGKVLGDKNSPIEIIPILTNKTWVVSKKHVQEIKGKRVLGSKFEYEGIIPMTAENQHLEMEETLEDGSIIRRDRSLNFYVLLANDVQGLPYIVSFRRTSYTAGKKLITHFAKMQMLKQPPAAKTLKLTCVEDSNDLGTYYKFNIEQGRNSTAEEINTAYEWYKTISKGGVKEHEVDVSEGATVDSSAQDEENPQF